MFSDTDANEVISHGSHFEINDNIDLSIDISSDPINNMAHDNGSYSADIERCFETLGNGACSSLYRFFASF